jgi:hypothetical protein
MLRAPLPEKTRSGGGALSSAAALLSGVGDGRRNAGSVRPRSRDYRQAYQMRENE